jgi:hypothetical protein
MRVQLTTDRAGVLSLQREGDIIDVPEREGESLVRSGQAIAIEIAMTGPTESAMLPRNKQTRKGKHHARIICTETQNHAR